MIFIKKQKTALLILFCLLIVAIQGCDQISTLVDYFTSAKQPTTKTTQGKETTGSIPQAQSNEAVSASGQQEKTAQPPAKDVIAKVGDWQLTLQDFKERLDALKELVPEYDPTNAQQNRLILEELVRQQLLVQEAERQQVDKQKEIVRAVDEFRRTLLVREMATRLTENIQVTDEEAKEFYDENQADFVEPAEWRIREIVVDTEEKAKELLVQLYQGADFIETAKAQSKGKTAQNGGDLGIVTEFEFPKMEDVVSALETGEISGSFKGPEGFYIVKLEDKKGGAQREFDSIKEDIKTGLVMLKQQQTIVTYLEDLKNKTTVDINYQLLEK